MAFGLAPQSLLAPLAALSLVYNLGMASYMLGEKYTRQDLYATLTIFLGTGISVSNAPHEEIEYNLQDLLELWNKDRMFYYSICIPLVLLFHYLLVFFTEHPNHVLTPSFFRVSGKSTSQGGRSSWKQRIVGFLRMAGYCGFAGTIGGQSLLFAKSVVELIKSAFKGSDAFWHYQTYFIIVMLALCLVLQVHFLNGGLKFFDSLYVIPVYQSYWILAGVIGGLVYFGEWEAMTPYESRMFLFGIVVTFCGLYILTRKESPENSARRQSIYDGDLDLGLSPNSRMKDRKVYREVRGDSDSERYTDNRYDSV